MRRASGILLAGVLAGALAACAAAGAGAADDPLADSIAKNTRELEALRLQIAAHRERIAALDDREEAVRRTYDDVAGEIEETGKVLAEMALRENTLLEQGAALRARLEASRAEFEAQRAALGRRLRALYIRGTTDDLRAVLTADNVSDLVARVRLNRAVARVQAGLAEKTRTRGRALLHQQRVLDAALAEIWQSRAEAGDQSARMELLQAEKSAALRELETERRELKNDLLELDLSEQKLVYLLEDLDRQRQARAARPDSTADAPALARQAGQLDWPVHGTVLRGFGRSVHPRFKTVTLNNGLNIGAPAGSPVAAVADGTVEFSDDLPGFGRCVILDHGAGYYTLYAHLERDFVAVGDAIARGQVIAEVGRPTAGEEPQLYFEIRHGRTPLDPVDWLRSR